VLARASGHDSFPVSNRDVPTDPARPRLERHIAIVGDYPIRRGRASDRRARRGRSGVAGGLRQDRKWGIGLPVVVALTIAMWRSPLSARPDTQTVIRFLPLTPAVAVS
jgi:hypothetical protein